jgi:hypothetical protein
MYVIKYENKQKKGIFQRKKQCCGSGIGCLFDPWIRDLGWVEIKHPDPGWRQFGSRIRDGKKSDSGSGINIPDPQHW